MSTLTATPATFQSQLDAANPGDTVALRGGDYPGLFTLSRPGVTVTPYQDEPAILSGPVNTAGNKPAWLRIVAPGATVRGLTFARVGPIEKAKMFDDWGILIEADDATVDGCSLSGMTKGIHIKEGLCPTITHNDIGPTYQSCIVVSTSHGVIRAGLIAWNSLHGSWREDAIQFMPDYDAANTATDVSNLGMVVYENTVTDCNENAIDLKGAGLVIVHGNQITGIGGSNDGPFGGWNHNANQAIGKGARTASGLVLIRNNDLRGNCSGIRSQPGWKIAHNLIADNNFSPAGGDWDGYGIGNQNGGAGLAVVNNLVSGHRGGDFVNMPTNADVRSNPTTPGPGGALTWTVGSGAGDALPVGEAGYFTDWFERADLPADVIWLGGERYEVRSVNYAKNILHLDRAAKWVDAQPVTWRDPAPAVGPLADYLPPVDPPVVERETVQLLIEADMTAVEAVALGVLMAGKVVTARFVPRAGQ